MKIYIDENMPPQLAEGLSILEKPNEEDIEVYSIKKEFGKGTLDEEWIPQVGNVNGIVITQDTKIQRVKSQYQLLKQYKTWNFFSYPSRQKGIYLLGNGRENNT